MASTRLLTVGVNHNTAAVALRERLSVSGSGLEQALKALEKRLLAGE